MQGRLFFSLVQAGDCLVGAFPQYGFDRQRARALALFVTG